MSYVDRVLQTVQEKNPEQKEFIQAVTEVLESLRPVIEAEPSMRRRLSWSASVSRSVW